MNKQIAMDWAAALCSGEYPQGFRALNEDGTCCALGVLAHLAYRAGIIERVAYERVGHNGYMYDGEKFCLSPAVMQWAGFQHGTDIQIPSLHASVMGMNDWQRMSFNYIGSIIRECYEEM